MQDREERRKKKAREAAKVRLSFAVDDGDEAEEEGEGAAEQKDGWAGPRNGEEGETAKLGKTGSGGILFGRVGKDPTVETDFLPDKERERKEEDLRQQLKQEFLLRQQAGARCLLPDTVWIDAGFPTQATADARSWQSDTVWD